MLRLFFLFTKPFSGRIGFKEKMHINQNTRENSEVKKLSQIFSFFAYAVSSVIFDILAYSISGEVRGFVLTHSVILFYFPLFMFPYLEDASLSAVQAYMFRGITQGELLIIGLTIFAFLLGILAHRHVTEKCNGETED